MAFFADSLDEINTDSESNHSFEDEDGFSNYVESKAVKESEVFNGNGDDIFESNSITEDNVIFVESNGPILPPPSEMQEEGFALREWRRLNAIQLEEKEKREKEILSQIIEEATEYKIAFHEKRKVTCENNKTNNREKEKLFLDNNEKFHKEADKNYWKAIAELIPNEVPTIENKRGKKKDNEKKPSITVIQGPKPGKPTDLSRMRQIFVKLKHNTPSHLNLVLSREVANANGPTTEPLKTNPETVTA